MKTFIYHFEEYDRRIFWVVFSLSLCAVFSYVYFLSISVHAVVARRTAEFASERLQTEIAQFESQYVNLDKRIDLAFAKEHGFVNIVTPTYIRASETSKEFTLRSR